MGHQLNLDSFHGMRWTVDENADGAWIWMLDFEQDQFEWHVNGSGIIEGVWSGNADSSFIGCPVLVPYLYYAVHKFAEGLREEISDESKLLFPQLKAYTSTEIITEHIHDGVHRTAILHDSTSERIKK